MHSSRGPTLALCILAILSIASPARAQDVETSARILLNSQTPWTTPDDPILRLSVRLENEGPSTIVGPEIGWILGPKVDSRVEYETSLIEGPVFPASAETVPLDDLAPGTVTDVPVTIDTSQTGAIASDDSSVYPLMIELRSEGERIAAVTTAAIHMVQPPQQPVLLSWWTEIAAPVAFAPDGRLVDEPWMDAVESRRAVVEQVEAISEVLADPRPSAIDLIVSPAALDQLRQAADGFRRSDGAEVSEDDPAAIVAAETLVSLREIATDPEIRIHAMPFAAPRIPALLSAGLEDHLEEHWRSGDELFERVIGERPDPTVARPPGLAFDQASIDAWYRRGMTTILGGPDSADRPAQESGFAPPAAAAVSTSSGDRVTLLLPDPGAQAMLEDPDLLGDPIRAAQAVLGELAAIWKERPVDPEMTRGLTLDLPPDLPSGIWGPLVRRLSRAPFLTSVHAEDLGSRVDPPPAPAVLRTPRTMGFSPGYVSDLTATAADVTAFAAMLGADDGEADRLRRAILYAEATQYIGKEGSGRIWIDAVNAVTDPTFERLAPDTSRPLTFTSRSGTISLRMGDPGDRVLRVRVELASGRVDFLDRSTRSVRIDRPDQVITFQVEVKAAGRSSIDVLVRSPSGMVLSHSELVVSSTAVNPIALIITVGAGLVLIGLWSRRLFRRRSP